MTTPVHAPRFSKAILDQDALAVVVSPGAADTRVPLIWLRDHCACPRCLRPETLQRCIDTCALEPRPRVRSLAIAGQGEALAVIWDDGHESVYPVALFAEISADSAAPPPSLWLVDDASLAMYPHEYQAIMGDDAALLAWLESISSYGFSFVRGVPTNVEDTGRLAQRIGYIRQSIFGGLWAFTNDLDHGDTAYTNDALDLHTDGTYCHDAPGLQMLHCLEFAGTGADSLLADGWRAAEELRRVDSEAFAVLSRVQIPGQYLEPGVHLRASRPVLRTDRRGDLVQVSFNNSDRAPFVLAEEELRAFYRALRAFSELIHDDAAVLRFVLEPGTLLVFDNWRVLHGRTSYTGTRRLCGCYLNREDFDSRLRILRAARKQ